ncbi:MAG: hypothetical protein KZQ80_14570 [Candidatus Thiodiazotropha sp. (ex Monitilora ramsayi)]|nr:hypothetical protein [Candidatus Thiodiazotropha sp. (ex Monitilora ramsayi)]
MEMKGVIIAPLAGVAAFAIFLFAMSIFSPNYGDLNLALVLHSIFCSYAGMIFVGIPIIIVLKKSDDFTLLNLAICGGVAGILVLHLYIYIVVTGQEVNVNQMGIIVGFLLGLIVAITYGAIAKINTRGSGT